MSTTILSCLLAFIALPWASAQDWDLIWSEEFDYEGPPDPSKWSFEQGFVRNKELQWYQEDNAFCDNGLLVIEGRRETVPNPRHEAGSPDWRKQRRFARYTSASINTKNKFTFQYGRLEVRARIVAQDGLWPAIWTLGESWQWPGKGEIDLFEYYAGNILANVAWASANDHEPEWDETRTPISYFRDKDPDWDSKYHVWRMDWTEQYIKLYLDDELLNVTSLQQTINPPGDGSEPHHGQNPFKQPHYILLNLAIGSRGGSPKNVEFPSRYEVDYVRIYKDRSLEASAQEN